ncbi:MAG TPA: carboxypeptidase regulatory-like domain-containing protein, partial [Longimicrobiales bacterium]|nr:carboxypeptidase regulatory-like domain-containing protein [Longimicrobiales bacterium]
GAFRLGQVRFDWPDGRRDSLDLEVTVLPRRAVTFWVGAEEVTVSPGEAVEVGYRLRNRGNATDTFRISVSAPSGWEPRVTPATIALAPGDTAAGTVRFMPPVNASRGAEHIVRVALTGPDVRESSGLRTLVVAEAGWLGELAHIPGTLFVGSSSDAQGVPGVALEAAGEVRPGTRVGLMVRHSDDLHPAPALRGQLGGPRLRLTIDAPSWSLRTGDVFTPFDLLAGPVMQGRGIELAGHRGNAAGEVLVAAPWSYGALGESGHIVRGAASLATDYGRFGLKAASVRRGSDLFGQRSQGGGVVAWSYRSAGHDVAVEGGVLAVDAEGAGATGFAGQARYSLSFSRGTVTARLRKVPATTRTSASQGNEAFASGSVRITDMVSATGWAFAASSPFTDDGPYAAVRGAAGGAKFRLPRGIESELLGSYRESEIVRDSVPLGITRSIRASLDVPVGPIVLEANAQLGTTSAAGTRPYQQLRSGVRWVDHGRWLWAGASYYDIGIGTPRAGVDLAGSMDIRGADVRGGLTARLGSADTTRRISLWTAATVPVTRETRLSLGLDHRPTAITSAWRLSLGASRAFGVPLPLRRQPALHGLVFEDLDGDRIRDDNEPLVPGVRLLLGPLRAATGDDGRFRFYDRAHGSLRLDPGRLRPGFVVPADLHLPTTGYVEIPVIRTASLQLTLFFDRDGDQAMSDLETLAAGVVVSLRDVTGRTRDAATDAQGRVRFGGLAPGVYTVTVHAPTSGRAGAPTIELRLTVEPGAAVQRTIPLPLRTREIRMRNGDRSEPN